MASMLASIASGYDVRMSNVSPVHPRLQPQILYRTDDELLDDRDDEDISTIERGCYAHSTYHGPTRHLR